MKQYTPEEMRKFRSAAEIVQHGDLAVIKKIVELEDAIEDHIEKMDEVVAKAEDTIERIETLEKGKDGFTPIKGIDYVDGENFVPTEADLRKIAGMVTIPVIEKIVERTEVIKERPIVTEIKTETKIENPVTGNEIIQKINDSDPEEVGIGISHILNLSSRLKEMRENIDKIGLIASMPRGGGGGGSGGIEVFKSGVKIGSGTALNFIGSGVSITSDGHFNNVTITGTGGGGGYTKETPTGAVNSGNTTFIVTSVPVYIVADGSTYFENAGYVISGLEVEMTDAPTQFIRSFY